MGRLKTMQHLPLPAKGTLCWGVDLWQQLGTPAWKAQASAAALLVAGRMRGSAARLASVKQCGQSNRCCVLLLLLLLLLQARNNARVMVAGSLDMFSNELFDAAVTVAASNAE
jgi:hypothetical protein